MATYYSEKQIEKARAMDLLTYLQTYEPTELVHLNCFYRRICEKAGIDFHGQHSLRHTFATRCIEAGVKPVVLKNWLDHTNIHITLDTYADVYGSLNSASLDTLEKYLEV